MLREAPESLCASVLKVGHHGSNTSSSDAFIEAAAPQVAVISVGEDNEYGHPSALVISRLKAAARRSIGRIRRGTWSFIRMAKKFRYRRKIDSCAFDCKRCYSFVLAQEKRIPKIHPEEGFAASSGCILLIYCTVEILHFQRCFCQDFEVFEVFFFGFSSHPVVFASAVLLLPVRRLTGFFRSANALAWSIFP